MATWGEVEGKPIWFHTGGCYDTRVLVMDDGSVSIRVDTGAYGVIGQQTGIGVRLVPESLPSLTQFLAKHCHQEV
jgi:hypothetical protein